MILYIPVSEWRRRTRNFFRTNYNRQTQAMGLVHPKTKIPIDEEFVIETANSMKPTGKVKGIRVRYIDGVEKVYIPRRWQAFGKGILKNCVLTKLEIE